MKFDLIVADPPYGFSDKLTMSNVKRGAEANYSGTMTTEQIKNIPVQDITSDNAILCLWVPSSLLQDGLDIMKTWGFIQKQIWVWGKTKKEPLKELKTAVLDAFKKTELNQTKILVEKIINEYDLNSIFSFGMGRLFRQCHEICIIGTKGSVYDMLDNRSQRSAGIEIMESNKFLLESATVHSAKPEILQDRLDIMFPKAIKLEMFGRRLRDNWTVIGNESLSTFGEDIYISVKKLIDTVKDGYSIDGYATDGYSVKA